MNATWQVDPMPPVLYWFFASQRRPRSIASICSRVSSSKPTLRILREQRRHRQRGTLPAPRRPEELAAVHTPFTGRDREQFRNLQRLSHPSPRRSWSSTDVLGADLESIRATPPGTSSRSQRRIWAMSPPRWKLWRTHLHFRRSALEVDRRRPPPCGNATSNRLSRSPAMPSGPFPVATTFCSRISPVERCARAASGPARGRSGRRRS